MEHDLSAGKHKNLELMRQARNLTDELVEVFQQMKPEAQDTVRMMVCSWLGQQTRH